MNNMLTTGVKRLFSTILALILLLSLPACGVKPAATWQEQYDLGVRYLSQGNYKEAILAFTAAIDIDPKQADAYVKLADVYTAQGDKAKAAEVLTQALSAVGENEAVSAALAALGITPDDGSSADTPPEAPAGQPGEPLPLGTVVRSERKDFGNGQHSIYEYGTNNRLIRITRYNADGTTSHVQEFFYDALGNHVYWKITWTDDPYTLWQESRKDQLGRETESTEYLADGSIRKFTYLYDGTTVTVSADITAPGGKNAAGSFVHTLLNAENYLEQQGYEWDFNSGKVDYLNFHEYDNNRIIVASLCINENLRDTRDQMYCRYDGTTVHMTYTGTVDGGTDTVSMDYTMTSPENSISQVHSNGWERSTPPRVTGITFIESDLYGEGIRMVYDVETTTFSKAEN